MSKNVLGHIDCPTCGGTKTLRITHDKNGDPFGYCSVGASACRQQLRIGGDDLRVESFVARYPWAGEGAVTVPEAAATAAAPKAEKIPVTVTVPKAVPKKATFADALMAFGGTK